MCSTEPLADQLPLDELERQICELAAHISAAMCRWLMLLAEFDAREGWASWGSMSCAHWLSWRCSITPRTAREHLRVAHRLEELPEIRTAFARGELTYSKVRAITRVAGPGDESYLLELARHATGAQLEKLVRGYGGVQRATRERAQREHERRFLSWYWDEDGSLRLNARLAADEGALVLAALEAGEDPRDDQRADERRADALVSVARAALHAPVTPRAGGDPCEVIVHVDAATLVADQVVERSEVADGPALAPETVRRLGCDAAIVRIIERDGEPLSVGRRTRAIPPALRRALRSRDRGCRFPGCSHRRFMHAHHIRHWAHGGPTDLGNLVQLCSYHHRLVHEGGFGVEACGAAGFRFRRPDGRPIADLPRGPAGDEDALVRRHARDRIELNADTCRPLSAGDRLDYGIAVEALLHRARASPVS